MMYGTAFDEITRKRHPTGTGGKKGLSSPMTDQATFNGKFYVLINTPIGSVASYAPFSQVVAGIDQAGNYYITVNGRTYFDYASAWAVLQPDPFYGVAISSYRNFPNPRNITVSDLIGALRWADPTIPFSTYTPPPAPTPPPVVTPPVLTAGRPQPVTFTSYIPPGFVVLPANWAPRSNAWPLYGTPPRLQPGGTSFDFAGAQGFYSLAPAVGLNSVGLDPSKLSAGVYAYSEKDLGAIQSPAGRTYELFLLEIFDTSTQSYVGSFFETVEGGGAGLLISDPMQLASRLITDISTFGTAEAVRFAAQKAGIPDSTIDLATELYAAAAVAVTTAGVITIASTPTAALETAFPVAADAGSPVALLPATAEMTAESAAGSTLLPTSLSLITPITTLPAAAIDTSLVASESTMLSPIDTVGGAVEPTTAASGTSTISTAVAAGEKAVATTVLATGSTALATEIKKLTGQLPPPAAGYVPGKTTVVSPTGTAPTPISPTGILAAIAAAFLLAKKA